MSNSGTVFQVTLPISCSSPGLCKPCLQAVSLQIDIITRSENLKDYGTGIYPGSPLEATCALCGYFRSLMVLHQMEVTTPSDTYVWQRTGRRNRQTDQGTLHIEVGPAMRHIDMITSFGERTPNTPIWRSSGQADPLDRLIVAEQWLTGCQHGHEKCVKWKRSHPRLYPTRLLDVSQAIPRLVYPKTSENISYSALSHCWGNGQPLKTTKQNLQAHLVGVNIAVVPKTFQDAITITKKLGLGAIWIDSICIIQDDKNDWEQEAAKMASVYESAEITIAAAHGNSGSSGCFHDTTPTIAIDIQSTDGHVDGLIPPHSRLYIRPQPSMTRDKYLWQAPLNNRKWVFQESLLSLRTLTFAEDQMHWRCASEIHSEDGLIVDSPDWSPMLNTLFYYESDDGNQRTQKTRDGSWQSTVSNYTRRDLKFASDKLAAIAGITKVYQRIWGDEPLLGLWRQSILTDLIWWGEYKYSGRRAHATGEVRLDLEAIRALNLPSWSWMKMQGSVVIRAGVVTQSYLMITDAKITWTGVPMTSKIVEAKLFGRGKLISILEAKNWGGDRDPCKCMLRSMIIEIGGTQKEISISHPFVDECLDESKFPGDLFFLPVQEEEIPGRPVTDERPPDRIIRGLILEKKDIPTSLPTYARVGVVSLTNLPPDTLEVTEERDFTLT